MENQTRIEILEKRIEILESIIAEKQKKLTAVRLSDSRVWHKLLYEDSKIILFRGYKTYYSRKTGDEQYVVNIPLKVFNYLESDSKLDRQFANSYLNENYETYKKS